MSRTLDALRRAEAGRPAGSEEETGAARPFRAVAVVSSKGGVGKTTIAGNLAVYVRALREDLPILVLGLDDQTTLDRMFACGTAGSAETTSEALRGGSFARALRLGQYGVHFVPAGRDIAELKQGIREVTYLERVLRRTDFRGLVVVDTKSDLEILTRNALWASDLVLVVVKDLASLIEAERVFEILTSWGRRERGLVLLSLVDLRIKFTEGADRDVLSLLLSEIRRRGLPLLETFLSRSPKVDSLATNPSGLVHSILHGASGSVVDGQMRHLADDVLSALERTGVAQPGPRAVRPGLEQELVSAREPGRTSRTSRY
jgi:cellulose biosynthesis protein BcsQ